MQISVLYVQHCLMQATIVNILVHKRADVYSFHFQIQDKIL